MVRYLNLKTYNNYKAEDLEIMNFNDLLDWELSSYNVSKNDLSIEVPLQDMLNCNQDWFHGIVMGILCVESNGELNLDKINKHRRNQQCFKHLPLKGLSKVHVTLPIIQSTAKNLGIDIDMNSDLDDPKIIETDIEKLSKAYNKITDVAYDKELNRDVPVIYKDMENKRNKRKNTGCWLIYGTLEDKRHYLMVHTGTEHTDQDNIIYDNLIKLYSAEFLEKFLQKN